MLLGCLSPNVRFFETRFNISHVLRLLFGESIENKKCIPPLDYEKLNWTENRSFMSCSFIFLHLKLAKTVPFDIFTVSSLSCKMRILVDYLLQLVIFISNWPSGARNIFDWKISTLVKQIFKQTYNSIRIHQKFIFLK